MWGEAIALKLYPLRLFQVYDTVLLTMITLLCVVSAGYYLGSTTFSLTSPIVYHEVLFILPSQHFSTPPTYHLHNHPRIQSSSHPDHCRRCPTLLTADSLAYIQSVLYPAARTVYFSKRKSDHVSPRFETLRNFL